MLTMIERHQSLTLQLIKSIIMLTHKCRFFLLLCFLFFIGQGKNFQAINSVSMASFLHTLLFLAASIFCLCLGQSLRTINGTLYFEIPGAALTLSATPNGNSEAAPTSAASSVVTQVDLNNAIQVLLQQTQPQVRISGAGVVYLYI